jgi:phage terminase large subunit-like protein
VAPTNPPDKSRGLEAVRLAAILGIDLYPWQADVLELGCRVTDSGAFASHQVTVIAPRRNGKTELVLARIIAGLYLFDEGTILYTAHNGDTARDVLRQLETRLLSHPMTADTVALVRHSNTNPGS